MSDRESLVRQFEAWLDRLLAEEAPPEGIAAEFLQALAETGNHLGPLPHDAESVESDPAGQYALWAALIAMTQEVKLQGRGFRQLSEALAPVEGLLPRVEAMLEACRETVAAAREASAARDALWAERDLHMQQEAENRARRELIAHFIDMRDRLARGLEAAAAAGAQAGRALEPTWLDRLVRGRAGALRQTAAGLDALRDGYRLTLERLDDLLAGLNVREIICLGCKYDPQVMKAVEAEATTEVPEGTVLEVFRPGYEWAGQLYRAAEVRVARGPVAQPSGRTADWSTASEGADSPGELDQQTGSAEGTDESN